MNVKAYIDDLNMRLGEISDITQQKMYWIDGVDSNIATSYDEMYNDLYPLLSDVNDFPFSSEFQKLCKDLVTMLDLYQEPKDYYFKGDLAILEDSNWFRIVEFSKKVYSVFKNEELFKSNFPRSRE